MPEIIFFAFGTFFQEFLCVFICVFFFNFFLLQKCISYSSFFCDWIIEEFKLFFNL